MDSLELEMLSSIIMPAAILSMRNKLYNRLLKIL